MDAAEQVLQIRLLYDRRAARSHGFLFKVRTLETSEHQQLNRRVHPLQLARSLQPIHHRHGEVQNDKVRLEVLSFLDRVSPVSCLATHLPVDTLQDAGPQDPANHRIVIDDENRVRQGRPLSP